MPFIGKVAVRLKEGCHTSNRYTKAARAWLLIGHTAVFNPAAMTCLECKRELSYLDHRKAIELFDVELCEAHRVRMERLMKSQKAHTEAIILYYALKKAGIKAMLAWWDGKKMVDLAVSRVKLNIEIDRGQESHATEMATGHHGQAMISCQDGFTTVRIPHFRVKDHLRETVESILELIEGLRANRSLIRI